MIWYERISTIIVSELVDALVKDHAFNDSRLSELELSPKQIILDYFERALKPLETSFEVYELFSQKYENPDDIVQVYFSVEDEEIYNYVLISTQFSNALNDFLALQNTVPYDMDQHAQYTKTIQKFQKIFLTFHDQYRVAINEFHEQVKQGTANYTSIQKIITHYLFTLHKLFLSQKKIYGIECELIITFNHCFAIEFNDQHTNDRKDSYKNSRDKFSLALKERGFTVPDDYLSNVVWNQTIQSELTEHIHLLENECELITELTVLISDTMKKLKFPIIFQP